MRLIRNTTADGHCKYALVRLDKLCKGIIAPHVPSSQKVISPALIQEALALLERAGVLEYAGKNDPEECFVIKLKDRHAVTALKAYARDVFNAGEDVEYGDDILELAARSAARNDRKRPD